MSTPADLITLPYTSDLNLAGLAYACRSLPYTYDRMGGTPDDHLRNIIGEKSAELAFRRHLIEQRIPYDNLGNTPFTDRDHYDIAMGGRRCDLNSYLVLNKERIQQLRHRPDLWMQAMALVPEDHAASTNLTDNDLFIFAIILGLTATNPKNTQRALESGQPIYLISVLPVEWVRPLIWGSLGSLVLKSEAAPPLTIEVGGQGQDHRFLSEQVLLHPLQRILTRYDYHSLIYLHSDQIPQGRIGISSSRLGKTILIEPKDWKNIWVYGIQIVFTGYCTWREFHQHARRLPAGSQVIPYIRMRVPTLVLPVAELHPLSELYQNVKDWKISGN